MRVEGSELLFAHAVQGGALGAPSAGEDAAAADHAVGVDAVDADAVLAELGGEEADLVGLVGLGGAVGDVVGAGEDRVLGRDVDDVATDALVDHRSCRRLADEEAALGHDVVLDVPVSLRGVEQRLGDREACVVDDQVDAAEGEERRVDGRLHGGRVGDVARDADGDVGAAQLGGGSGGGGGVEVGDHDAGAVGGEPGGRGLADAAGPAGDQGDAAGETPWLREALELGLLERPVLDAELLRLA